MNKVFITDGQVNANVCETLLSHVNELLFLAGYIIGAVDGEACPVSQSTHWGGAHPGQTKEAVQRHHQRFIFLVTQLDYRI